MPDDRTTRATAERPILFSAPMVRAILDGRKTQTRRVVKPQPVITEPGGRWSWLCDTDNDWDCFIEDDLGRLRAVTSNGPFGCPYATGDHDLFIERDRLWVRETWGLRRPSDETEWHRGPLLDAKMAKRDEWIVDYRADWGGNVDCCHWRPSIHMPRWASRITLEVTGVRVERVQEITPEDAEAEGVDPGIDQALRFRILWDVINGKPGRRWADNPWVWVITFQRETP